MKNALIIFTRAPIAGQTKTRLMPFLTGEECARLHKCFITDIMSKMKSLNMDLFVFYTPKDKENLLKTIVGEEVPCLPQEGKDLGERMKRAIGEVLRKGYEKVLLVGTDIPQMGQDVIEEAFFALDSNDIVIHPTLDGGYYLIGMKREYDSIWKVERYGTNTVICDTLNHMEKEGLLVAIGHVYYDVDDKDDFMHLYNDIKEGTITNCPATEEYLKEVIMGKLAEECIHCGRCTKHCLFLEKYNIDLKGLQERPELSYHCFLCGSCKDVCPKGIDGKEVALHNRKRLVSEAGGKLPDNSYDGLILEKSPYKFANYRHAGKKSVLFTGCNFPSFYPETTDKLVAEFKKHGVGVVYDCCGKPIEELGLLDEAKGIVDRINKKLNDAGVEQVVMACPNCYYFLKGRLDAEIISVYEKMKELGIGKTFDMERVPMYFPCPDRKEKQIAEDIKGFLSGEMIDAFPDVQCCGLGGCAAGKEADLVEALADKVKNSKEEELYTYCASCICSFRRRGYENAKHILPILMEVDEKVPLGKTPILNRAKCKFK